MLYVRLAKIFFLLAFCSAVVTIYLVLEKTDFGTKSSPLFTPSLLILAVGFVFVLVGEIFLKKGGK